MSKLDEIIKTIDVASAIKATRMAEYSPEERSKYAAGFVKANKQQIKDLIQELIDETFDKDDADAYRFWQKIKAL